MMVKLFVDFCADHEVFLLNFEKVRDGRSDFDTVVIDKIPTIKSGLSLIHSPGFEQEILAFSNVFAIILKINEKIDENFDDIPLINGFNKKKGILFAFVSTIGGHESKAYWRISTEFKYKSIFIGDDADEATSSFLHDFLIDEIKNNKIGILEAIKQKSTLDLHEIGTENGNNLLYLATKNNNFKAVESLLAKGLDPENNIRSLAIDAAWNNLQELFTKNASQQSINNNKNIIMSLLNANSRFPSADNWYDSEMAPQEVKEFLEKCENLHSLVDQDDFTKFSKVIENDQNLVYYYNKHNQSVFVYGLKSKKYQIINHIKDGLSIGNHEDLTDAYNEVDSAKMNSIRRENEKQVLEYPDIHILNLYKKSKFIPNDQVRQKIFVKKVNDAFATINSNSYCSKLLKIAALWTKLRIFFDFNHNHAKYLSPKLSTDTKAVIYTTGEIYIGAKELMDEQKKFNVFGVIIHELCHAAMLLVYCNNFEPYTSGENSDKAAYESVMAECRQLKDRNWFVGNSFEYPEDQQHSELIVTYPQALMTYLQNAEEIENFRNNFHQLLDYCEKFIELELNRGLLAIELVNDEHKSVNFDDLTPPMQMKILNSVVVHQKEDCILSQLYEKDPEIVNDLTSKNIKDLLLTKKKVEIVQIDSFNGILERNLENYEDQEDLAAQNQTVIICSFPGSGVSTFLRNKERKLKKLNKNLVVTYLDLSQHKKLFNKFINKPLDMQQVLELFGNKKLSADLRAVYLLDGLDQIWTDYGEFWLEVFKIIKTDLNFELWIAATPRQTQKLEEIFSIQAVKFAALTDDEIKSFIKYNLRNCGIEYKDAVITEMSGKTLEFLKYLSTSDQNFESEMDNLTLIKDIISIYTEKGIRPDSSNLYEIFSKIDRIMYRRFDCRNEECIKSSMSIHSVHEILALMVIFGEDYEHRNGFKLNELAAVKAWSVKNRWTFDGIQDYGFIGYCCQNNEDKLVHDEANLKILEPNTNIEESNLKNAPESAELKQEEQTSNTEEELNLKPEETSHTASLSNKITLKFSKFNPKFLEPKLKAAKSNLTASASNIFAFASNVSQGISNLAYSKQSKEPEATNEDPNLKNDLNVIKIDGTPIRFVHKSFADFFVARFIVDFVTGNNSGIASREISNVFKLLEIIAKNGKKFARIREFIVSSPDLHYFDEQIRKLAVDRIAIIHNRLRQDVIDDETLDSFEFFAKLFKNYEKFQNKLWKIDEHLKWMDMPLHLVQEGQQLVNYAKDNVFKPQNLPKFFHELSIFGEILYPKGVLNVNYAVDLAEYCFGPNWHEILNQSGQELKKNSEMEENLPENWKNDAKIQKLCSFVDKNFNDELRRRFIDNLKALRSFGMQEHF